MLKDMTHLPVIFDPSHSVGIAKYVPATSLAAVAMGVDGLMVETHFYPSNALSDGYQTIDFETFEKTYKKINNLIKFMDEEG
jgi:3-deoxy-7-phosphoheptulonate synthase